MAATAQNVSFASPLADAKFAQIVGNDHINDLLTSITELSAWKVVVTILLVLVAYDQCLCYSLICPEPRSHHHSQLSLAERIDRWPIMEDSIHRTFSPVSEPKMGRIQGEMG